ncbi:MAG: LacI family DNA-binding transcriptional regulator [Acetivibrio sp.]
MNKEDELKNITISDIAQELGISKTTVSRAISGKGRIGEDTRNRVLGYIEKCDYSPNFIAKSLAQSKTFNIAVILPADSNLIETPFFQSCLMGICEITASMDYDVVVATTTEDDITQLKRIIKNHKVDGVVLTRPLMNDIAINYLKSTGTPFVIIGSMENPEIIQIDSNHVTACSDLTALLLMSGNSSIGLVAGNLNHIVNQNRYEGFLDGFKKMNRQVNPGMVCPNCTNAILVRQGVTQLIKNNVDCIICTDDLICSQTITALDEMKLRIPEEIKIASFYNSMFLEHHHPPITALNVNVKEIGIKAGKQIIDFINGNEIQTKAYVNYELIMKESTK